jgi:hypothetical protein
MSNRSLRGLRSKSRGVRPPRPAAQALSGHGVRLELAVSPCPTLPKGGNASDGLSVQRHSHNS